MKVVILLTLLGACLGLHPNLEFQYRYSARVASGIPSINNNFAGAGIQADLTIQITSSYDIFFKLSNIEVGEYHDEIECDTQAPLPIEYRPLVEGKELLEKPFQVHPGQQKGEEYIVTPIEPAWITNIRKALTRAFGIPPLLANIGRRIDSFKLPAYSVNETLIHGECTTWYSVIRLNEEEAAREDHEREEDIQRDEQESDSYTSSKGPLKTSKTHTSKTTKTAGTKTTGTKTTGTKTTGTKGAPAKLTSPDRIANTLWRLTRTVAFDTCEDLVKWKIHGNKKIDKKIQRSSIGTYLIRGNERSARIEYAVIEGSISLFTSKQEHVSTFTNLTLELKAVRSIRNLFTINYEIEKHESFVYEVDTFSVSEQEPGHDVHPSLEQLVTGIPITSQGVTEIKVLIIKLLKVLVKRPTTFPYSKDPLVKDLSILVDAVSILSKPEIQALTSQIEREELPAEKLQIFYEVLVTAGTEPAIRYLLDKIKDPEFRKANKALTNTFVENFHLSVKSPLVIPDIIVLEQALSWTEDDQEFKISVLLNLASLAKQLCISSEKWETFGYNTCDPEYTCTPDSIIENFLPSLVQGIQDDESPLWVKLVYIQALANLGLPQTIDVLKHFVVGDKPSTSIQVLRTTAIFGISGIYLPKTAKSTVFSLLIPVFENTAEHFEVRNVAFLAMMTYEPSLAWWERIAISTWRDPSSQVASFVSSTFTSLANSNYPLSKIASRVVHLVKPAPHVSLTHSAMVYLNDYLYNCKSQHFLSFGWFASTKGLFPSKIILRLQFKTFLGFATEFKSTFGQEEINKIIKKAYITFVMSKAKTTKSSDAETVQEMFDEIVDQLGLIHTEKPSDSSFYLLLTDYISLVPPVLDSPENILTALTQEDIGLSTPHIDREVDYSEVFPTDLGLPFTIHFAEEVAYWFDWKVTETQSIPTKRKDLVNVIFDVSLESTLEVKTLLPWSTKFGVGAGLHNVASFIFPLSVHTKIDNERTEVKVTIEPQDGSQVQLFNSHNYPFTVVTGPFPTAVHTQQAEYKKITAFPLETLVHKHQVLPAIAGLSVETHWTADFVFQPDLATFLSDDFDPLIPAYKAWDYTILYDPAASTTKSFTFTFTYVTLEKLEDETQGQTSEQLTQETQEADYFDFASQSHVGGGSLEFQLGQGETDSFGQQQQLESQSRQRIVKLQEELMPVTGGIVRTVSVGVELQAATKKRSYESVVTWVISKTAGEIFTKVQLSLIKNPAEGTLEEPHATCFNVQLVKPAFLPMPTLEEVLNVNFHTTIEATVFDGESCSSAPVLEVQGTLDVSDEVIRRLREEVAKDCDLADSNLLPIDVITSPLYDHAHFTAKWTEDYPVILKNLTYHIDDIIRHCLYPFTTYDHTVINPENTIDIDATKCLNCNKWTIRNERPELVSVTKGLSPPVILNEFLGPAEIRNVFFYNFVQGRTSFQCTVETTKVRTHDGVKFPYHPDNCWTTLSYFHPLSEEEAPLNAVVSARFTEEWEVRIVWKFGGYLYEFTKSQLLVNGEPCPEGGDDNVRFIVLEDASYFMLKSATLSIKVSDKIEVLYPYMARGSVDGLCGRMDGERTGDLVGPQGCIYTDPKLFALAWTTKGDGCAQFSLRAKKRAVENFQEVCPRESHVPTGVSHPNVIYDCTAWQYIERFYGDYKCRTIDATPVCKDTCKATRSVTLPLAYDCQVFGHRKNTTHQECHPHSIITTFPASCVP
ncbi:hemolymph clottable protein [Procambarus clarkii]|uniref:hemolymph clottable protein n=1 Tax=Procambarus clarkii TaxID=6728 RepID=UPI003742B1C1